MPRLRPGLALAALLGGAAYLAFGTGPFLRWLAAAAVLIAALELRPRLRLPPRLRAAAPWLVLAVLVLVLLGELLLGRPPASRDHAIHYFQTELLVHDLLPAGHLSGWSDRLGQGYTLGDAYPVLGYLWMGAAHLLTLGLVPLRASYALGILAMWLLAVGGVARLAACIAAEVLPRAAPTTSLVAPSTPTALTTIAPSSPTAATTTATTSVAPSSPTAPAPVAPSSPATPTSVAPSSPTALTTAAHASPTPVTTPGVPSSPTPTPAAHAPPAPHWPAWAGCIGGALWLLDAGASREGGWEYLMFHGVWPQLLATALWISALPVTLAALREPSPRRIALAGGLLGLAILAHPFALLSVAGSAAAWAVLIALGQPGAHPGRWRTLILVHGLAAALAAGWLASFFAAADTLGRSPVPWLSWGELATRLLAGELFADHRAWVGPLALIGLGLALRRGATLAWLTAGLFLVTLVLASDAAVTVLRLDLLVSAFKNIQFPRYAIVLKPLWYALAGVGAAIMMLWAARSRYPRQSPTDGQNLSIPPPASQPPYSTNSQKLQPKLLAWTACIVLAPLLAGAIEDMGRLFPAPVGARGTLEASRWGAIETELHAALAAERAAHPDQRLKIAFLRTGMGGGTFPIFALADERADLVLDGHIPSLNSVHRIRGRSVALLRDLGVTHVLHDKKLPKREQQLADSLTPIIKSGPYTLARFDQPANPRAIPGLVSWTARDLAVTATRHDAHAVDLDVSKAGSLHLLAAPDRKWRATFLPADGGEPLDLPTPAVALHGNDLTGTHLAVPGPGRVELRYRDSPRERGLAWFSLAAGLAALVALRFGRPLQFAGRLHSPAARRLSLGLTALTAALLLALAVRRQTHQLARTWEPLLRGQTFVADLVDRGAYRVTMSPADTCDGLDGRDARHGCSAARDRPRRATLYRDPYLYRCLWVTVPARGSVDVAFDLPADAGLVGQFQRRTPGGKKNRRLTYGVDARKSAPVPDKAQQFTAAAITFSNGATTPEHICLIAAAVAPAR